MTIEDFKKEFKTCKFRQDVIPLYVKIIVEKDAYPDWPAINAIIIERWSKSALMWIKEKAWKQIEAKP